ncbi:LysR family transcriptional regulator [Ruegeria aquimaris]|uniref:LysR family transcriptional regulator n=1 Tax=Ruegeria aquimaris TaxID=2984333 RepID=A0ABT3AIV6_9RHOB|nr:LysR family transcriptional regulator [Ruegeria sp. XHP0148]MCV2888588.1 LysR family transcriptional regulator [Ruegeria sp. XHP0148]
MSGMVYSTVLRGSSEMKRWSLNWSDIRVFLAVYREGSTLAASRVLGVSQPTVARQIETLEHQLGLTLFERDTRGFRPTLVARDLLPQAEMLEASARNLEEAATKARKSNARPIRITASNRNFSPTFTRILAEFSDLHPETRFELIATYDLLDLAAGEADVAIRITPQITDERLICSKLTDVKSALFASRSYAERRGLPAGPEDFAGHSFVVYDPMPGAMRLNRWLMERISPDQIVARCGEPESVTASIEAGLGIGPVAILYAIDYPTLVRCFDPVPGTDTTSWLVIGPDAYRRPEVRAFAAFFAPRFRTAYVAQREQAMIDQAYRPER